MKQKVLANVGHSLIKCTDYYQILVIGRYLDINLQMWDS